jgi:hypothetical protein
MGLIDNLLRRFGRRSRSTRRHIARVNAELERFISLVPDPEELITTGRWTRP